MKKTPVKFAGNSPTHWIFGVIILVTGVVILGTFVSNRSIAQGNQTNANLNVIFQHAWVSGTSIYYDGGGPIASGDPIPGIVGGSMNVILNVWVTEDNGYNNELVNLKARIIRTSGSGNYVNTVSGGNINDAFFYVTNKDTTSLPASGPVNCNLLYTVNGYYGGTNTDGRWQCRIPIHYLSDPTTTGSSVNAAINFEQNFWQPVFWVYDDALPANVELATSYFEYPNILGLTVEPTISLEQAFGDNPSEGDMVNVENKGNQQMDIALEVNQVTDDAAWACVRNGGGALPGFPLVSDIHFAVNSASFPSSINKVVYNSMHPLNLDVTGFGTNEDAFDLDRSEVITAPIYKKEVFSFASNQPIGGNGVCTLSSIVVTALKGY